MKNSNNYRSSIITDGFPLETPGTINARLDRLPSGRYFWTLVSLISIGGWFEFYDILFTAYVGPGLVKSGILTATTTSFFGLSGLGAFVSALFAGLFIGTCFLSWIADRFGRRTIFTFSLLWYSVATLIMSFQTTANWLNLWRLIAGIGIGVELITIQTYIAELVPRRLRGRAFSIALMLQFSVAPVVTLLAYLLVPTTIFHVEGWRWVVLIGTVGALVVWSIRRNLPESPRWLAQRGRLDEADRIVSAIEERVAAEYGRPLPLPEKVEEPATTDRSSFSKLWTHEYRARTMMLMVFHFFQSIGYFGFASWVPTLMISRGIEITHSLLYSFLIALANPIGPLLVFPIADRMERKWVIVIAAVGVTVFGVSFASTTRPSLLVVFGLAITLCSNCVTYGFNAYQPELFPTSIRARATGFVYSIGRLSAVFSGFLVAFILRDFGVLGVFALIVGSMAVVAASIGLFGPRTRHVQL